MSILSPPPASSNGHERKPDGVRTYRGRRLEDIIPQIREELGPDAVILRQREGLTGGVSGFFAQRCVEVDARPGTPPVDFYDDEDDHDFSHDPGRSGAGLPGPIEEPAAPEPVLAGDAREPLPPVAAASFATELADAETSTPDLEFPVQSPAPIGAAAAGGADGSDDAAAAGSAPTRATKGSGPVRAPRGSGRTRAPRGSAPARAAKDARSAGATSGAPSAGAAGSSPDAGAAGSSPGAGAAGSSPSAGASDTGAPAGVPDTAAAARLEDILAAVGAPEIPAPAKRTRPSTPKRPARAAAGEPRPTRRQKRGESSRKSRSLAIETLPAAIAPPPPEAPAPRSAPRSRKLEDDVVAEGVHELTERGLSDSWARQLIAAAAAHSKPFADGELRDAVLWSVTADLPAPAQLPAAGAAVAIVGAGGAGKTRTAAALASAYGRGSTLEVTVVALGSVDDGREITELLRDEDDVHVQAAADACEAASTVKQGRRQGLVVIDTAATRRGEPAGIAALAAELETLAVDAVYIAVPATLSARAARDLVDSFASLAPAGIVITHADEIDHLGVTLELSHESRIPIAYVHEGLELRRAMSAANPFILAQRLLP